MRNGKHLFGINILIIAVLVLSGCDVLTKGDAPALKASGVVEIMNVSISAEIGGRVSKVFVEEGTAVTMGDSLFSIDDEELQLQRTQVIASGKAAVAGAELALLQARQALTELNENWPIQAAQYQVELAQARDALKDANYYLTVRQEGNRASSNTIDAAEANLILANEEVDRAQQLYDQASGETGKALALSNLIAAKQQRDSVQRNLNWYLGTPTEIEQAMLDADVALADARVTEATQEFEKWKDGPDPDAVALARANVANAEALLELAQVQAEGQLRSIELVLEDTVIRAPIDAVILNSSVEEGEVIAPGVTVMTLGNVDRMTITVYLAENQYGKVSVGDLASVTADSFPGEAFEAEVVRIADEAEYTPRNVQTEEERQTTVYALDLRVLDPEGKLKPGMPADVVFALVE
ncbi:MAG: HlyD family efflux transporter periplasmic adaptor subunit [Anaerolineales bacterium]